MKYNLLFIAFILAIATRAQFVCSVLPYDTIVCYKDSMIFTAFVSDTGKIGYQWQKNKADIPSANDSIYKIDSVRPADTGFYRCIAWEISNPSTGDTSNEAHLRMHPKMNIDTLYRLNELGCPGICKGQFSVHVSGGKPPYIYNYGGGHYENTDTIVSKLCPGTHIFRVTDSLNCSLYKKYYVDVLKLPKIVITIKTSDSSYILNSTGTDTTSITIYLTNPNITVSFPDTSKKNMTNWMWNFGDNDSLVNVNPAQHTYQKTGKFQLSLNFTDQRGCDTTIIQLIEVKIAQLKIPNVFTPNDDNINEKFTVKVDGFPDKNYLHLYLSTELYVFDRWGRKVFHAINYKSGDWDGRNLPDGVYFYVLKCQGEFETDVFRGSVTILGRNFSSPQ